MRNFDRSTVKHGNHDIQNDCHQQLPDSIRVHKIRIRLGPGPHWGAYSALPDPLAPLRGPNFKGKGREEEMKGRRGIGPLFANSWIRPWLHRTWIYDYV